MTRDQLNPWRIARRAWRGLWLGLAFLGEQLRRLPGSRLVERFASWIAALLLVAALVSLAIWMAQRSPQRVSMADLTSGGLSYMQTWVIVSGDVRAERSAAPGYQYVLTDPAVPIAVLRISSQVELALGQTTVSGRLIGGAGRAYEGFGWVGQLRADPVLASEQSPPWVAIAFATCAVLLSLLARTSYPVFFSDEPWPSAPPTRRLRVGVRRDWPPTGNSTPGTLDLDRGGLVRLCFADGEVRPLRLYSTKSGVEIGRLHRLTGSEPALALRASAGDLTISFASAADRDGTYAALVASVALPGARG